MALIHYYKFNGNLYDSIGAFDLVAGGFSGSGPPVYVPGKLGGSTGALTSSSIASYRIDCKGNGAAPSGFMATDTTEATNGVLSWSVTGWIYLTGFDTDIINLTTLASQSTARLQYSETFGNLYFNNISISCSTGTWVFFTIRVTGGVSYLSINGGSESSNFWITDMTFGGKTLFNGIVIGSSGNEFHSYIDDLRIFNHSLSPSEISAIYNSNSPSENSIAPIKWNTPIHHYAFTDTLNDGIGSVNGTFTDSGGTYTSGLFTNSLKSCKVNDGTKIDVKEPSANWISTSGSNPGFTVSYWQNASNTYFSNTIVFNITSTTIPNQGISHTYSSSGTSTWSKYSGIEVPVAGTPFTDNAFTGLKIIKYDSIAKRITVTTSASNGLVIGQIVHGTDLNYFNNVLAGMDTLDFTSNYQVFDDLRIFNSALVNGADYAPLYNSGNGTEISFPPSPGSASGLGRTVTVSGLIGVAFGNNVTASGAGRTVTVSPFSGIAAVFIDATASGLLATIVMSGPIGTASDAYASGLLGTITVSPITGISPLAFGSLGTIQVTSFSGQAAGGALSSGALASVTVSSFTGIAFPEFIGTGSLSTISVTAIEAVASISTSIQLSYCACDAEIGWQQSLPITGFVSAVQGEDAISARITPVVSGIDANIVFFEQRTLTASSSYTYDLRSLTDFLGQSFSLSRAYAISVVMTSGSATISPGASNPLQWFFNSTTANVTITSGNSFMFAQKGSAIVSNSAKTILVTNPSGLSACVYKIAILGGR
jgi:hypothetical protein